MDRTKRNRTIRRVVAMIALALLLAAAPPMIIQPVLRPIFFMKDGPQVIADQYLEVTKWAHFGGIIALLALNLGFFSINERRGDFGITLKRRNKRQGWMNVLVILAGVGVMAGLRYLITTEQMIGRYLANYWLSIVILALPYIALALTGAVFALFCMRAVPATNSAVLSRPWRKSDDKIKRAARTRA
jgi:hypothetical protein